MLRKSRRYLLLLLAVLVLGYFLYRISRLHHAPGISVGNGAAIRSARRASPSFCFRSPRFTFAMRFVRCGGCDFAGGSDRCASGMSTEPRLRASPARFLLGRAGEPIRPVLIARKSSLSMPGMFGVYVLERVFDMAATALLAVVALLLFERKGMTGLRKRIAVRVLRARPACCSLWVSRAL